MINFIIISSSENIPHEGNNTVYLRKDQWNDYSFVTMFDIVYYDELNKKHELGQIKIGFKGQETNVYTHQKLPQSFQKLGDDFFSIGVGSEYYKKCCEFNNESKKFFLSALNDVVAHEKILKSVEKERVFKISLLRDSTIALVKQYKRILNGGAELTNFEFFYKRNETEKFSNLKLDFCVKADSTPSTNIHAIIGRNGIGKTTLLNGMIKAICDDNESESGFYETDSYLFSDQNKDNEQKISDDYFTGLVSVSFSIFDSFTPPQDQNDRSKGICYHYVGLKKRNNDNELKNLDSIQKECFSSLKQCFSQKFKSIRWQKAIETLYSDVNFASMDLLSFNENYKKLSENNFEAKTMKIIQSMSSGHSIVLLIITKLVELVEEKTLVLIDEPESHLHPPLLSAFIRSLSDLLHDRNGIAILATHSPVILQEIPKSCTWILNRSGRELNGSRPEIETFGENVGILTKEIFKLEVEKSGFCCLLNKSVDSKKNSTYETILSEEYGNQLGYEGKFILRSLINSRKYEETD